MTDLRFYAACLASYNAGRLHGAWIDASTDVDEMQAAINKMLRASPYPNVEVACPDCDAPTIPNAPPVTAAIRSRPPRSTPSTTMKGAGTWANIRGWNASPN